MLGQQITFSYICFSSRCHLYMQHGICPSGTHITPLAFGDHECKPLADRYAIHYSKFSYYLFAWGDNRNGQLGIGNSSLVHNLPEHVSSLVGVPFALLCAGGYHSFALSLSGALFSWGRNKYVCLADSTFVLMVLWPGNAVQVFTQNSFFIVKESF